MKIAEHKSLRYVLVGVAAVALGTAMTALLNWLAGSSMNPNLLAAIACIVAVCITLLASRGGDSGIEHFIEKMGEAVDHIMIGAAETAYFVDSIKKKIDQDVATTQDIVGRSEETAQTTEQIAANAERASKVASDVRSESVAGRAEVDQGLRQISNARQDAQTASDLMTRLQEKSRRIHGITEVINEIAARFTTPLSSHSAMSFDGKR